MIPILPSVDDTFLFSLLISCHSRRAVVQHCGMKVKVLKVEQPEGRSERATVELRNGVVLQVRSSECADLGTPQARGRVAVFIALTVF